MTLTADQINAALATWCADVRNITGDARKAWITTLKGIDGTNQHLVKQAISNIADRDSAGRFSKAPNRRDFINEYSRLKNESEGKEVGTFPGCSFCGKTGLVCIVTAQDDTKGGQRPVPKHTVLPASRCYVVLQPCSCARGLNIYAVSYGYTWEKARSIVTNFGYAQSAKAEAEAIRQKCEEYYLQLRKDGTAIDQSVGFRDGEKVFGFTSHRNYEPNNA